MSGRVTWLGHATRLLEVGGARLLTDPVLRSRFAHLARHAAPPRLEGPVDAVLVSHLHHDHLDLPSLRAVGAEVPVLVPRGAGVWLRRPSCDLTPGVHRVISRTVTGRASPGIC